MKVSNKAALEVVRNDCIIIGNKVVIVNRVGVPRADNGKFLISGDVLDEVASNSDGKRHFSFQDHADMVCDRDTMVLSATGVILPTVDCAGHVRVFPRAMSPVAGRPLSVVEVG